MERGLDAKGEARFYFQRLASNPCCAGYPRRRFDVRGSEFVGKGNVAAVRNNQKSPTAINQFPAAISTN